MNKLLLVGIGVLSLVSGIYIESLAGEDGISPEQGVVLSVNRRWISRHWAGDIRAKNISLDMERETPRFTVGEANLRSVWTYYYDLPVDFKRYPIFVLKYRAENTHTTSDNYVIWLDDGTGPDFGGKVIFTSKELIPDGAVHELRKDLRELNPKGAIIGMALGVMCGDKTPAVFELMNINFEAVTETVLKEPLREEEVALNILVVDSEEKPVYGAKVIADAERRNFTRSATTKTDGTCEVRPLVNDASKHMLRVEIPGMVPVECVSPVSSEGKPVKIVIKRGNHYGGIIQDEGGKPVKDVTVSLHIADEGKGDVKMQTQFDLLTDASGRWKSPLLPDDLNDIWIRLYHPDFISDPVLGMTQKPPMEKLRDGTGVMVLKKGFSVTGIVMDEQGHIISGAIVKQGQDRHGSHYPTTYTDKDGYFIFDNSLAGEMVLTVQSSRYASELKVIQVTEKPEQIEFVLHPGGTIRGRVITSDRKPAKDVMVFADTWRGYRTIDWGGKTDAEGHFQWDSAPSEEVKFDIVSKEYMSVRGFSMKPSPEEYSIVVNKPTMVRLNVVDDITGNPVTQFEVMEGRKLEDTRPVYWSKWYGKLQRTTDGYYEFGLTESGKSHALRIVAEGYLNADTPFFEDNERTETFEMRLKKGEPFQGIVTTQDGRALSGAEVGWVQGERNVMVNGIKFERQDNIPCTKTDNTGRFVFPPQSEPGLLVILHEEGWKKLKIDKPENILYISVESWAVIKGKAWIGVGPAVNQQIMSQVPYEDSMPYMNIHWATTAITEDNGSFVLSYVPAGDVQIGIFIHKGNRSFMASRVKVRTEPGKTYEVQIGGTGQVVMGRVILSEDITESLSEMYISSSLSTYVPRPELPSGIEGNQEKLKEWWGVFIKTPEGQAFVEKQKKAVHFTVYVEPDGSFKIDDIPPGTYQLQIQAFKKSGRGWDWKNMIALGTSKVTVSTGAMPIDGPIYMGNILLERKVAEGR